MAIDDPAYPFLAFSGIPSVSFHFISPNVSQINGGHHYNQSLSLYVYIYIHNKLKCKRKCVSVFITCVSMLVSKD